MCINCLANDVMLGLVWVLFIRDYEGSFKDA